MHVTLEIEERDLPKETIEYRFYGDGGWWKRKGTFTKQHPATVYSVIATVHFEQNEMSVIRRAGLTEHTIWEGPEELYFSDNHLKSNLELPRRWKFKYDDPLDADMLQSMIDDDFKDLARKPTPQRRLTNFEHLAGGVRHIVYDCKTLAVANAIEHEFREGLVKFKRLIEFNDQQTQRVSTFEL
jgi:hypothetical protein